MSRHMSQSWQYQVLLSSCSWIHGITIKSWKEEENKGSYMHMHDLFFFEFARSN